MKNQLPATIPQPPMRSLFDHEGRYFSPGMLFVIFLIALSWVGFFDTRAIEFIDSSLVQSFAAFAIAKGLNAVIGLLESSDVSFAVASIEIGKIFAPAKELIDQFAEVMEYAIGSLMLQKLLITISSSTFFKVILTISGVVFILFRFFRYKYSECYQYYNIAYKVFVTVLFARFFFIVVFGVSTAIDSAFISEATGDKIAMIENTQGEVNPMEQVSAQEQEERRQLELQRNDVIAQLKVEQNRLQEMDSDLEKQASDIAALESQLDELNDQVGVFERLLGSKDEEKQDALDQRKGVKAQLTKAEDTAEQMEEQREAQQEKIDELSEKAEELEVAIDNFGKGFVDKMKGLGLGFITTAGEKLNSAADTALELTIIFIFKSVLMPLLFLFAGYKFFLKVWGYDVRDLRRTDWREAMGGTSPSVNGDQPALPSKE